MQVEIKVEGIHLMWGKDHLVFENSSKLLSRFVE